MAVASCFVGLVVLNFWVLSLTRGQSAVFGFIGAHDGEVHAL